MKIICTSILFMLLHITMTAQVANNAIDLDIKNIASQVEILRKAIFDADASKLKEVTSTHLSYGHSGGLVESQDEFIEKIIHRNGSILSLEFPNQTISIAGKTAIVRNLYVSKIKEKEDVRIGVLQIWQKQKKNWLLIARQGFKLPLTEIK